MRKTEKRYGRTTSRNGRSWHWAPPRGRVRGERNGESWLPGHLWRPNGPLRLRDRWRWKSQSILLLVLRIVWYPSGPLFLSLLPCAPRTDRQRQRSSRLSCVCRQMHRREGRNWPRQAGAWCRVAVEAHPPLSLSLSLSRSGASNWFASKVGVIWFYYECLHLVILVIG